jgi:hypothetical protein
MNTTVRTSPRRGPGQAAAAPAQPRSRRPGRPARPGARAATGPDVRAGGPGNRTASADPGRDAAVRAGRGASSTAGRAAVGRAARTAVRTTTRTATRTVQARPQPRPAGPGPGAAGAGRRPVSRTPFILLLVGMLGGGLLCLLVINTTLAAGSFRINNLQQSNAQAAQRAQALQQQVAAEQSPGSIEQRAERLGMRMQSVMDFVDLRTGRRYTTPTHVAGVDAVPGYTP